MEAVNSFYVSRLTRKIKRLTRMDKRPPASRPRFVREKNMDASARTDRLIRWLSRPPARVPLGVLLVAAPAIALLPHLRGLVSRNAVVTAFVHTARAPISGRLTQSPATPGTVIAAGASAALIENPRAADDLVAEQRSAQAAGKSQLERLDEQLRLLDGLERRYAKQLQASREGLGRDTDLRIATLTAELKGLEARLAEARRQSERAASLEKVGLASQARLETAQAALASLEATRDARREELRRIEGQRRELAAGGLLVDGHDDAVRLSELLSRLGLERLELVTARARAASSLDAIGSRLAKAEALLGRVQQAPVEVPDGVLVWEVHSLPGQHVEAGAPVFSFVNCRELLLDMRVDDSVLSLVRADQPSRFRLFGSPGGHLAHVAFLRGSAAPLAQGTLAASVPREGREGQVLSRIELDPSLPGPSDSCGIGRTAYVKLDGIGLYRELVRRLIL